jgi:uncharacterized protein (TIGR00299 family) protein
MSYDRIFAYCDCFSGVSGDMFLGALLDVGAPVDAINDSLKSLLSDEVQISSKKERRGSIWGTRAIVNINSPSDQPVRTFRSISALLEKSSLPSWVISKSIEIFRIIAEAESTIHNVPLEEVHFHEIGALDSIADIVGSVMGLYTLNIRELISSPLPIGTGGTIQTQHGLIPLPAPATLEILKGIPVYGVESKRELVTPTGAAILKTLSTRFGELPSCTVEKIGYGVGSYPSSHPPNMLRLIIASAREDKISEKLVVLEANIDDMPHEIYEHAMNKLFAHGALDVWLTPIVMKKSRPAVTISVLCPLSIREVMENILFLETSTAGIRSFEVSRKSLQRAEKDVETPWGTARVKVLKEPNGLQRIMPEYESCRELAERHGVPLIDIYRWCLSNKDIP